MSLLPPIRNSLLLCYVTDRRQLSISKDEQCARLTVKIAELAAAGVDWIQIREKDLGGAQLSVVAREAIAKVGPSCRIIVNDRLDVACAAGAAGVHLGENSISVRDARSFARDRGMGKDFLIGASVHSLEAAKTAGADGADYILFGPVFATPSKVSFGAPQGLGRLKGICGGLAIPVLAIGGITTQNAAECYRQGAYGMAGIRIFQDARDPDDLVKQLRSKT